MSERPSRRILILREDVSRKIAAGEVIDRPFSVLRELLDNAIDAGASSIECAIEGGGQARIRVADDGEGMAREDLSLCWQRHATSKIQDEQDLYRVHTLGFRGEALASVAACARLSIVSRPRLPAGGGEPAPAFRLVVAGGRELLLEEYQGPPGTVVDVADLFFNLPARRRFLKSPSAESALCRQALLEKALPHPGIAFRFSAGGELKHFFPALKDGDYRDRVAAAFGFDPGLIYALAGGRQGLALHAVVGRPELTRRDRRMIQLYVNRRRILEFALVQAVEYAFGEYVPGGHHPVAFVFLELDPAEVDFNIHPAKREVRFRDLAAVRRLIGGTLREFLTAFDLRRGPAAAGPAGGATARPQGFRFATAKPGALGQSEAFPPPPLGLPGYALRGTGERTPPGPAAAQEPQALGPERPEAGTSPRYRGQVFGLFLLAEYGDSLYVVDQHAAHERVLFEELKSRRPAAQELLMPIRVDAGPQAALLAGRAQLLGRLGLRLEEGEDGSVEIAALPEELLALDEDELVEALLGEKSSFEELEDRVFSLAACRLAVKEGEELDGAAAAELIRRVFALDNARCPHGRPIWTEIRRADLERSVGRQ